MLLLLILILMLTIRPQLMRACSVPGAVTGLAVFVIYLCDTLRERGNLVLFPTLYLAQFNTPKDRVYHGINYYF